MARESKILRAIKIAEDFLVIFDSYFRDPVWVTENLWLSKEKFRKSKWHLIENDFVDQELNVKEELFNIYKFCKKWDGKWRIVFFDIPEPERVIRDKIRRLLKELGFKGVQRSVWISPLPVNKKVKEIKKDVGDFKNFYLLEGRISKKESFALVDELWDCENWQEKTTKLLKKCKEMKRVDFNKEFWSLVFDHPKLPLSLLPSNWPLKDLTKVFVKKNV